MNININETQRKTLVFLIKLRLNTIEGFKAAYELESLWKEDFIQEITALNNLMLKLKGSDCDEP